MSNLLQRLQTLRPPSPSPCRPTPDATATLPVPVTPAALPVPATPAAVPAPVAPVVLPALATVPERERQLARERAEFVQLVQERRTKTGESEPVAAAEVAMRDAARFPLLSATAGRRGAANQLSVGNFRLWRRQIAETGEAVRRYHRGARRSTPGAEHPFIAAVSRFYLHTNRLPLKHAWTLARAQARAAGLPPEQVLSYAQVSYFFKRHADQNATLLARMGAEWFQQNRCGYIERDWSDVEPGECWIGDHHQFDAPCRVLEDGSWLPVRPWLTGWLDVRSGYLVGWRISAGVAPNCLAIEDAFLNGIRAAGNIPPAVAYTDNGKDYAARGFAEPVLIEETRHSILLALGCDARRALPYNARAKTIERTFGVVAGQFSRWFPGYRGNCPENRPDTAADTWGRPEDLPSIQQFTEAFAYWLERFYHATPGESKINGGMAPALAWGARLPKRAALSDQELYFAFLHPVGLRQVERGGRVRLAGHHYQSEALWPRIGKKVLVKADRVDQRQVMCFEPDGRLLAPARLVEQIPALASTDSDRQRISDAMAGHRRLLTRTRAILTNVRGPERVAPAAIDRLALVAPEIGAAQVADAARRAEIAAARAAAPVPAPAQDPAPSPEDLAAFGESVRASARPAPAAGVADFAAFLQSCSAEDSTGEACLAPDPQ